MKSGIFLTLTDSDLYLVRKKKKKKKTPCTQGILCPVTHPAQTSAPIIQQASTQRSTRSPFVARQPSSSQPQSGRRSASRLCPLAAATHAPTSARKQTLDTETISRVAMSPGIVMSSFTRPYPPSSPTAFRAKRFFHNKKSVNFNSFLFFL